MSAALWGLGYRMRSRLLRRRNWTRLRTFPQAYLLNVHEAPNLKLMLDSRLCFTSEKCPTNFRVHVRVCLSEGRDEDDEYGREEEE